MDQVKIGRFIAECRKNINLTQMQLADKLGITDKAVSKWERGVAMPDSSIMLELCDILQINVNELLSGEIIDMENNNQKNEQILLDLSKEIAHKNKTLWTAMWVILAVSIIGLFGSLAIVYFFVPEGVWQIVLIIACVILFLIPAFFALKIEVSVGAYKCKKCGHEFIPTYSEALWAMHAGTTRYLKCPECSKHSWCKKVFKK